jgi:glycine oxidase
MYPAFVELLKDLTGRDVGYRPYGTLEPLLKGNVREELSTLIALHHGLGLKAEALSRDEAIKLEPGLSEFTEAAILRPEEASVDNRLLVHAVLAAMQIKGAELRVGDAVLGLRMEGGRCVGLRTKSGDVEAGWTIVAAGCFSAQIEGAERYAPTIPAKGQMLALRSADVKMQRVIWGEHIYLVPRNDGRLLVGATVEYRGFDRSVTAGAMKKLLDAAIELVPGLAEATIEETWAGLRPDSPDHLPILGPVEAEGLLFATGHFRSGVLLTPITAQLIREWVTEKRVSVDWGRFRPMRFLQAPRTQSA